MMSTSAVIPPLDIEKQILRHYAKKRLKSQRRSESTKPRVTSQLEKPTIIQQHPPKFEDFIRNQERVAHPSDPLQFRQLPRKLKVYFPKGPTPPPELPKIPYTYEEVPMQPVKWPKRKRGYLPEWVFDEKYYGWGKKKLTQQDDNQHNAFAFTEKGLQLARKFQKSVKKILNEVKIYKMTDIYSKNPRNIQAYKSEGSRQFFIKVKEGDADVEKVLSRNPNLINDYDEHKLTPLHWAAREGHSDLVRMFMQKFKANGNLRDVHGRTPMHLAVLYRRIECIYRLFIEGAKLTALDNNRKAVKDMAPDIYTKYVLEKLDEIRFLVNSRGPLTPEELKNELENQIRKTLDPSSAYF